MVLTTQPRQFLTLGTRRTVLAFARVTLGLAHPGRNRLRRRHQEINAADDETLECLLVRSDNEATLREVLRFLDVDENVPLELVEANPTVRIRSQRAYELLRSLYLGRGPIPRAAKAAIKALTPTRLRRSANAAIERRVLYGDPRPPDEALMLELRRRFKPEVVAISEYLGRDLVGRWGYDRVD